MFTNSLDEATEGVCDSSRGHTNPGDAVGPRRGTEEMSLLYPRHKGGSLRGRKELPARAEVAERGGQRGTRVGRRVGSGSGFLHAWPQPLKELSPSLFVTCHKETFLPACTAYGSGAPSCPLRLSLHSSSPSPITKCALGIVCSDRHGLGPQELSPPPRTLPGDSRSPRRLGSHHPGPTCPPHLCCPGRTPATVLATPGGSSSCVASALCVLAQLYTNLRSRR